MRSLWLLLLLTLPACHALGNKCQTFKPLANPESLLDKLRDAQKNRAKPDTLTEHFDQDLGNSQRFHLGKDAVVLVPIKVVTTRKPPTALPQVTLANKGFTGVAPPAPPLNEMLILNPEDPLKQDQTIKTVATTTSQKTTTTTTRKAMTVTAKATTTMTQKTTMATPQAATIATVPPGFTNKLAEPSKTPTDPTSGLF